MATTTYEEEKKQQERVRPSEYGYTAPVGTYYGEAGNPQSDAASVIRQRYAELADPARQAEQDERIRRSRSFWTGANLFANVMANAINANGTANGAPNMTWNNEAETRMYNTWADADRQLKGDRRAAMERLTALDMQDAQMRAAAAEKRAAEQKHIYDVNYQNEVAEAKAANDLAALQEQRAYNEEQRQRQREESMADKKEMWDYQSRHPHTRSSGGGSRGGGSRTTKSYDFPVGRGDGKTVHATNTFEQQMAMAQIADELKRVMNSGKEPGDEGWASYDDGKEYNFIARNFDRIYDNNPDFRQWFDENFGGGGAAGQTLEEAATSETPVAVEEAPMTVDSVMVPDRTADTIRQEQRRSSSASGAGKGNGQYQDGGYFLGSRQQHDNQDVEPGKNRVIYKKNENGTTRLGSVRVEGNKSQGRIRANAIWNEEQGRWEGPYADMDNGRYVGTTRAPHKLTEKEKELIKKNGEKPKINY